MREAVAREVRVDTLYMDPQIAAYIEQLEAIAMTRSSAQHTTQTDKSSNDLPQETDENKGSTTDSFDGTADMEDLANFYSFVMMDIEAALRVPQLSMWQALSLFVELVSVCILVFVQLLLAYGFYDASNVLKVQTFTLPGFRDPLPFSFWYMDAMVPGTQIVMLNCVAAVCAILLLGVYLKADNEGTLGTVCPLELLCLPRAGGEQAHAWSGGPLSACWRVGVIFVAQVCWCIRTLLVPALAGMGTVGAMLNSQNGQDIVLNSVAVGFVLELDEFIYANILGKRVKLKHEARQLPSTSALAIPSGSSTATVYANLIYLLDITFLLLAYFQEVYQVGLRPHLHTPHTTCTLHARTPHVHTCHAPHTAHAKLATCTRRARRTRPHTHAHAQPAHHDISSMVEVDLSRRYDRFRNFIMIRCTALIIAHAHLTMMSAKARAMSHVKLIKPVLVMTLLGLLVAAAMYTLVLVVWLDGNLGAKFHNVMLSPKTMACATQQDPFVQYVVGDTYDSDAGEYFRDYVCPMLDGNVKPSDGSSNIYEQMLAAAKAANASEYDDHRVALAWGRYPPPGYYFSHVAALPGQR